MSLSQGSTFINDQYGSLGPHLWIIISDPALDNTKVVIVNISSWRTQPHVAFLNDKTCIVNDGDHPFIDKKSYVYYGYAMVTTEKSLQDGLTGGVLEPNEDCSPQLLEKILVGVTQSPHTPLKVLGILQEQGLID